MEHLHAAKARGLEGLLHQRDVGGLVIRGVKRAPAAAGYRTLKTIMGTPAVSAPRPAARHGMDHRPAIGFKVLGHLKNSERPMTGHPLPEIAFGPFRLDVRHRRLSRNGTAIGLGERALDVLCALVAAEGALVTKSELMARVWPDTRVEENNLQVPGQPCAVRSAKMATAAAMSERSRDAAIGSSATRRPSAKPRLPRFRPRKSGNVAATDGTHLAVATLSDGSPWCVRRPG